MDVGKFNVLFDWMKINNPVFANFQLPTELHPKIIGGEQTPNNTDGEVDLAVESVCEVKYYFPSTGDPNDTSGTFEDSTEFATAIMSGMTPTLLFHPGNYANDRNTSLEEMFPVQFPFGVGGPKALRLTHVSGEHGLQHLMCLSLRQFHRHMFILVGYHVFNRILSFRTGLIMSKGYVEGEVLANRVSSLTVQEVMTAGLRRRHGVHANLRNTADGFLHAISTACAPIGHSNEAADKARKRYFALWDFFGPGSIFVTVSPCDERSFRLKLFAGQIECKLLPSLCWTDEQCIHDMIVRRQMRSNFPGACSLEFESIMQVVIEHLFGWNIKKQMSKGRGIFGVAEAFGGSTEEQNRATLHEHMIVHVRNFHKLRQLLFSVDDAE